MLKIKIGFRRDGYYKIFRNTVRVQMSIIMGRWIKSVYVYECEMKLSQLLAAHQLMDYTFIMKIGVKFH